MGQAAFETTAPASVSPDDYLRLECEAVEKHDNGSNSRASSDCVES